MPGGFVFRLEGVLRLRLREEQQQQRVLAEAVAALLAEQNDLAALRGAMGRQREEARREQHVPALDMVTLRARSFYLSRLERRAARAAQRVEEHQARVEAERRELARRTARRKALDKLRERRFSEYRTRLERKAQAEQDERGAVAYLQRRAGQTT